MTALQDYPAFDSATRQVLDDLGAVAARACNVPFFAIGFIGATALRFASQQGLSLPEIGRADPVCEKIIAAGPFFEVAETANDADFAAHPWVAGPHHIRFWASARLETPSGLPIGALCVFDAAPRPQGLDPAQVESLKALARQVMNQLDLRKNLTALAHRESRFAAFFNLLPQIAWSATPSGLFAHTDYVNQRWVDYTGRPFEESLGAQWDDVIHPEDSEKVRQYWQNALESGDPFEIELRLRGADGSYRWFISHARPVAKSDEQVELWFGTCTDIHELKESDENRRLLARELSHRIKNIFTVVGGLAMVSGRGMPEVKPFVSGFLDRLNALALAHEYVRPHMSEPAAPIREQTLFGLIETLLAPYDDGTGKRFVLRGLDHSIGTHSATAMALILHEQATNAVKYGALSTDSGQIEISGQVENETFALSWIEKGGPDIPGPPQQLGFGTLMAARSASGQLRGELTHRWDKTGLVSTLTMPRDMLAL